MNEWVNLTEYNWAFWVAGLFALFEFFKWSYTAIEWIVTKFGFETKRTRQRKEWNKRLEDVEAAIVEIKNKSKENVEMFLGHEREVVNGIIEFKEEIIGEFNKLHRKIDQQKEEINAANKDNDKTDRAMLRDRIAGGMRYFSQNKDEAGNVHISLSDYENMDELFQRYFAKDGNGAFHKMYMDEFQHFVIDR